MKLTMAQAPILALPNFKKQFLVETDTSKEGIRVSLQQGGHPLAFVSKALNAQHQALSTYQKEFIALVFVVEKWRPYFLRRKFIIKTSHQSPKYLMEQRILTLLQRNLL